MEPSKCLSKGLPKRLHWVILQRDPIPIGLDDWRAAARREIERKRLVQASLRSRGGDFLSTRQNLQRETLGRPSPRQSRRDPDAMEVDAASADEESRTGWREKNGGVSKAER